MIVKVNGVKIKSPHAFSEERYNITKANRLANGNMSMELVAQKKKYLLTYQSLSSKEFDKIMQQINTTDMFFDVTIDIDNRPTTLSMYVGAIKRDAARVFSGETWYWQNITFNWIQR